MNSSTATTDEQVRRARGGSGVTRALLGCAMVGGPLFVIAMFVEGATRAGYSPARNYVSQLATGPGAPTQVANFLVCAALMLAAAVGMRRALAPGRGAVGVPIAGAVFGLGLLVAGVLRTDPSLGYPAGIPDGPTTVANTTLHGRIHGPAGIAVFVALTVAAVLLARRFRAEGRTRWVAVSWAAAVLVFATFVISLVAGMQTGGPLTGLAGLFQRIAIVAGWLWVAAVAGRLRADSPAEGARTTRLTRPIGRGEPA